MALDKSSCRLPQASKPAALDTLKHLNIGRLEALGMLIEESEELGMLK